MNKVEITIESDELITALTRLAKAIENKGNAEVITSNEPNELGDLPEEEPPIASEQPEEIKEQEKPVTLEQVRAVLTAKSQAGKKAAIGELIKKYGATKLTAVDPARFSDLLKEAESL